MNKRTLLSNQTKRQATSFAGILSSGMAIVALALMVVLSFGTSTGKASAAETVTICHAGATLTIPAGQLSTYYSGGKWATPGDYMGPCRAASNTAPATGAAANAGTSSTTQQTTSPAQTDRGSRDDTRSFDKLGSVIAGGGNTGGGGGGTTTNAAPAKTPTASPSPSPSPTTNTANQSTSNPNWDSNNRDPSKLAEVIAGLGNSGPKSPPPPPTATPEAQPSPVVVQSAQVAPTWTQQVQNVQTMNVNGDDNRHNDDPGFTWPVDKVLEGRIRAYCNNQVNQSQWQYNNICNVNCETGTLTQVIGCNDNPCQVGLNGCDLCAPDFASTANFHGGCNPCNAPVSVANFNGGCNPCNAPTVTGFNGCDGGYDPCDTESFSVQSGGWHCGDWDCNDNWMWWCGNVGGYNPCDLVPDGHGGWISPCRSCDTIDNVILGCGGFNCHKWDYRFGDWDDWKHRCNVLDDDFCDNWDQAISYGAWLNNCHNNGCDNWDNHMGSWDNWNNWCHHDPCDKDWDWNWNGRGKDHDEWWKNNHDRDCRNDRDDIDAVIVVCDDGSRHVIDFNRRDKHVVRWDGKYDGSDKGYWWDGKNMRNRHEGDVIVVICPQVKPTIVVNQVVNVTPPPPVILQSILPQTVSPAVQQAQPTAVLAASAVTAVRPPSTGDAGIDRIIPLEPQPTMAPAAVPARSGANSALGIGLAAGAFVIVLGLFRLRTSAQRN